MRWRKEKEKKRRRKSILFVFFHLIPFYLPYLSYLTFKVFLSMMRETVEVLSPAREVDILYLLFLGTMYLL